MSSPINNENSESISFDQLNESASVPDALRNYVKALESDDSLKELQKSVEPLVDPLREFKELIKNAKIRQ